jgi:glyoxylase-like metal-dependent hydrolase (beta-lactamase superfamily II)
MDQVKIADRKATATEEKEISKNVFAVAPGVWRMKDIFVNVFIIQNTEGTNWVLVDAGLKSSAQRIKKMAADIFGTVSRPSAIVLTHGHFDHVGSLQQLADEWGVPVYAHHLEVPYLTGKSAYPPPDPTVGGGMMTFLSPLYPRGPINIQEHLRELPEDGSVPEMPEWKYVHTPGHSPGHISLFRQSDGVLVAGDAVVTTNQQSVMSVMAQKRELNGPPKYFTCDWGAAARSLKKLVSLKPEVIATGHGHTFYGLEYRKELNKLSKHFWDLGMPSSGRYLSEPALTNEDGVMYVPPAKINYPLLATVAVTALALATFILYKQKQKRSFF